MRVAREGSPCHPKAAVPGPARPRAGPLARSLDSPLCAIMTLPALGLHHVYHLALVVVGVTIALELLTYTVAQTNLTSIAFSQSAPIVFGLLFKRSGNAYTSGPTCEDIYGYRLSTFVEISTALTALHPNSTGRNGFRPNHLFPPEVYLRCLPPSLRLANLAAPLWDRLRALLLTKKKVSMVAVGGSETVGVGCDDSFTNRVPCAWPARLRNALGALFPAVEFQLANQAMGGSTITSSLPYLALILNASVDLLLVDFIINDSLAAQEFPGSSLEAIYESFILRVRQISPGTSLVFVITCPYETCLRVRDAVVFLSSYHDVGVLSFYDAVECASALSKTDLRKRVWSERESKLGEWFEIHPPWHAHQLIADVSASIMYYGVLKRPPLDSEAAYLRVCANSSATLFPSGELFHTGMCVRPVTVYSATSWTPAAGGVSFGGDWALREDRPGKPGWISAVAHSSITFDVTFGASPVLLLSYLKSYAGLGSVAMTMTANEANVDFFGLYPGEDKSRRVSQVHLDVLNVRRNDWIYHLHDVSPSCCSKSTAYLKYDGSRPSKIAVAPYSRHNITFTLNAPSFLPPQSLLLQPDQVHVASTALEHDIAMVHKESFKFKLVSVASC